MQSSCAANDETADYDVDEFDGDAYEDDDPGVFRMPSLKCTNADLHECRPRSTTYHLPPLTPMFLWPRPRLTRSNLPHCHSPPSRYHTGFRYVQAETTPIAKGRVGVRIARRAKKWSSLPGRLQPAKDARQLRVENKRRRAERARGARVGGGAGLQSICGRPRIAVGQGVTCHT